MRVAPTTPGLALSDEAMRDVAVEPARDFSAHAAAVQTAFDELNALLRVRSAGSAV